VVPVGCRVYLILNSNIDGILMSNRQIKAIFRKVRDANLNYHLIENGDRVAVGLSGGKDSFYPCSTFWIYCRSTHRYYLK